MLVAGAGTGLLLPLLGRHFVDVPNERSSHAVPVPRGGGLGVVVGIVVTALLLDRSDASIFWPLPCLALLLLLVTGLVDDMRTLGTASRLVVQAVAGVLIAVPLADPSVSGALLAVVGVVFVVGLVNAFNFMDGINGISAVTVMVAGGWLMWLDRQAHAPAGIAAMMVGSSLGFLLWNAAGRVFLGDVGSYFLGGLLAVVIVLGVDAGVSASLMVAPVVLYVGDTVGTLIRRAFKGHRVGAAHREHIYQQLTRAGLPHLGVAVLVGACEVLVCASTWLLRDSLVLVLLSWAAVLTAYVRLPSMARDRIKEIA